MRLSVTKLIIKVLSVVRFLYNDVDPVDIAHHHSVGALYFSHKMYMDLNHPLHNFFPGPHMSLACFILAMQQRHLVIPFRQLGAILVYSNRSYLPSTGNLWNSLPYTVFFMVLHNLLI